MSDTATDCPKCPQCKGAFGMPTDVLVLGIICGGCGALWVGTPSERAQADAAERAWLAECETEKLREQEKADRARARQMFVDAGREPPEWCR